jgi:hypothetical protein
MPEDAKIILTGAWLNHGGSSRTVSVYTVEIYSDLQYFTMTDS